MMPKPEQIEANVVVVEKLLFLNRRSIIHFATEKNKGQKEALPQKWKVSCSSILYCVQDQGTKAEGGAYSFTGGCKLTETQPGITSSVVLVTCCSNDIDLLKNLTQVWSATFY